ncbi:hypothetical protein EYF80_015687 [Liparis tanakae]|uniref:Uncharacterized protein n=1 Tax=Liparis tanakae TaxID=230148 RepID=A0A4Z2I7M3_9TELE|nr:hypothetical protein EYF80_015687 [Liparis tanakae]
MDPSAARTRFQLSPDVHMLTVEQRLWWSTLTSPEVSSTEEQRSVVLTVVDLKVVDSQPFEDRHTGVFSHWNTDTFESVLQASTHKGYSQQSSVSGVLPVRCLVDPENSQIVVVLALRPNGRRQQDEEQQQPRHHDPGETRSPNPEDNPVPHHQFSQGNHNHQRMANSWNTQEYYSFVDATGFRRTTLQS